MILYSDCHHNIKKIVRLSQGTGGFALILLEAWPHEMCESGLTVLLIKVSLRIRIAFERPLSMRYNVRMFAIICHRNLEEETVTHMQQLETVHKIRQSPSTLYRRLIQLLESTGPVLGKIGTTYSSGSGRGE